MAVAAVTCLLEQLKEVVIDYKDLISRSEDEFNQLQNDLSKMKGFLKAEAEESSSRSLLQREITEVLCETQETIDTLLSKAKNKSSLRSSICCCFKSSSLAKKVRFIRKYKLRPLLEKVNGFADWEKLPDGSEGEEDPQTEFTKAMPIREDRVVGYEDEAATITEYLMKDTDLLDVISIIGKPGQGKTTLARKIYENKNVCNHFPVRIWVCITKHFNSRDVFLQILRNIIPSLDEFNLSEDELAATVRMLLKREKFLLVLDDIWSVGAWNTIEKALPLENCKGKVLLTSREKDVGMYSSSQRERHMLLPLTEEESWKLLQLEVFGKLDDCPPELDPIGRKIALKCDGLPLTIVVIGGILLEHLTKGRAAEEWKAVSESLSNALQKDKVQDISRVIKLTYNKLPYDLRVCFVYMGIFPEDYEVPVQMLLRLWIAEGFIASKNGRSLEESGEEILNDLIRMNLLQAEKTNHMGKVKTCRVHGMVRAFCISKSKEDNLFGEMKMSDAEEFPPASDVQKLRRLCLSSDLSKFLSKHPNGLRVRSFMCFYEQPDELGSQYISVISKGSPMLRILESRFIKFHEFPAKVTKLIHLRYLTLLIDELTILPESISKLWNLQTLVVETKTRSITMKANMWKMIQLKYLKTKAAIILDSTWDGEGGQNLQTLNRLSPDSCTEPVSKRAKNLKTLGISGNLVIIFERKFLQNLHHLEKLKLVNSLDYKPTPEYKLPGLFQSNCFPPNLKRLTLEKTFLEWKHMSTLAKIDTLEVLKLRDNAFIGSYWNAMGDCFRQLQLLLIVKTGLVIWEASSKSFPVLKRLVLKNCENLDEIPVALAETLQKLDIEHICQSAVDSAMKIAKLKRKQENGESKSSFPFALNVGPVCLG